MLLFVVNICLTIAIVLVTEAFAARGIPGRATCIPGAYRTSSACGGASPQEARPKPGEHMQNDVPDTFQGCSHLSMILPAHRCHGMTSAVSEHCSSPISGLSSASTSPLAAGSAIRSSARDSTCFSSTRRPHAAHRLIDWFAQVELSSARQSSALPCHWRRLCWFSWQTPKNNRHRRQCLVPIDFLTGRRQSRDCTNTRRSDRHYHR